MISDFLSHEIGQKNMSQPKVGEEQPLNTLVLNLAIVAKHESTASTEASRLEPLVVWFTRQRLVDALFVHTFDVSPRLQAFVFRFRLSTPSGRVTNFSGHFLSSPPASSQFMRRRMRATLVSFVAVAGLGGVLGSASPPVKVTLKSSWSAPPLLLEIMYVQPAMFPIH